jgi:hypothetical protein
MNAEEDGFYDYLTGYSALTTALGGTFIYNQLAPEGQAFPYVIFTLAAGGHENIVNSELRNVVFLAKAVSETHLEASTIDGHLYDRLHGGSPTISGWTVFWCKREDEVNFVEMGRVGLPLYHKGAYYRLRLDKT